MSPAAETDYRVKGELEETNDPEHRAAIIRASNLKTVERQKRVLNLRRNGFTYDEIAVAVSKGEDGEEPLEITASGCRSIVSTYLSELDAATKESVDGIRQLDNERLERMFRRLEIDARSDTAKTRERAIRTQLAVLERHAKLNGLDAPTKIEGQVDVNVHGMADAAHVGQVDQEFTKRYGARKPADIDLPAGAAREITDGEPD